ncbi:MAG TPA: hypothetical protein VG186_14125, partial [Solirubrobacteraceae bacterium]|nr:hypothetical protein [Solirubrobacteraceae bacterium]
MPLRRRLAFVAAAAVGVAIVLVAIVAYMVVRAQLRGQVDDALRAQAVAVHQAGFRAIAGRDLPAIPPSAGGPAPYVQLVGADGSTTNLSSTDVALPVSAVTKSVAQAKAGQYLSDVTVGGSDLREITIPVTLVPPNGGPSVPAAIQLARPLAGV